MGANMQPLPKNAALIVINIQNGFDDPYWGNRNNLQAEQNVAKLLEAWRRSKRPVLYARYD
jgi:nicotinamidase-related amidase